MSLYTPSRSESPPLLLDVSQRTAVEGPRAWSDPGFPWTLALLVGAAIVLPYGYAAVFLHETDLAHLPGDQALQLLLSTLCNLACLTAALSFSGRFDRKITQFATFILTAHGLLAVAILGFRLFYLKSWFFTDAIVSLSLGGVGLCVRHKAHRLRLAVIDSQGRARQLPVHLGEVIVDPGRDLSGYDVLLLTDPEDLLAEWAEPLSRAMLKGQQVRHWAEYLEESRGRISLEHFHPDQLTSGGLASYRAGKRLVDLVAVLLLAPLVLPVLLLAMIALILSFDGPVFFTQMRVGRGGRPFRIWKLRTMRADASVEPSSATAPRDPRITPVGALLRRFHIDELPQLWNILVGEMSLIGPRPEMTCLAESYVAEAPVYAWRHLLRPGVTGWAQVCAGYAGDLEETRVKLSYDLFYVKNLCLTLDLKIMARTFWTLLAGIGAR
jgi:lipopolysaccharide/colanic/teichoic acid biosynthesis glycosyltransferase